MSSNNDAGRFVWYENLAKDPRAAISFYTDVMGWNTQPFPEGGDYVMWVGSQGPLGGVMQVTPEMEKMGVRPHWMAHVLVANVDAAAAQAKKLGGKIHKEPADIAGVGRFAVIGDPQGAFLCIFAPTNTMTPHDPSKPGEFCWSELMTSDPQAAVEFYTQLFGWKIIEEMDMERIGTYRVFGKGENRMGGIMAIPKGANFPPMWIYYTETPDLDAAIARARGKGGTLMNGPMDVPGGGRVAQLTDSQGAAFALHQAPRK